MFKVGGLISFIKNKNQNLDLHYSLMFLKSSWNIQGLSEYEMCVKYILDIVLKKERKAKKTKLRKREMFEESLSLNGLHK